MCIACICVLFVVLMIRGHVCLFSVFFLMIRRPPRSTLDRSSAASDVYKRQGLVCGNAEVLAKHRTDRQPAGEAKVDWLVISYGLSLIHISEPTRPY